jgi:protein arginine N-methyltransferase 3
VLKDDALLRKPVASRRFPSPPIDVVSVVSPDWSDSESDEAESSHGADPARQIIALRRKLAQARKELAEFRAFARERFSSTLAEAIDEPSVPTAARDDDSHYFQSYDETGAKQVPFSSPNAHFYPCTDIHAVMIQDKVRTSAYASFILMNPSIFRDAVVLDVGCGTGILSLFAARGGAKRVFAVEASGIAERAEKIVKANGLDDVLVYVPYPRMSGG